MILLFYNIFYYSFNIVILSGIFVKGNIDTWKTSKERVLPYVQTSLANIGSCLTGARIAVVLSV